MQALGKEVLVELYGCNPAVLDNVKILEQHLRLSAQKANATVVKSVFHRFSPYGVSGVVVIAESHIAIHTWPEYRYAAVDIFTCGDTIDPWIACDYLKEVLEAESISSIELRRGNFKTAKGEQISHKPSEPELALVR